MARVSGHVNDGVRLDRSHDVKHRCPIANVELVMHKGAKRGLQPPLIPLRVAGLAEEYSSLIVIHAVNLPSAGVKVGADF
jgi:hypothetical protein